MPAVPTPPAPHRGKRWKRLGCGCLATSASLVVGLLVLEWILRTYTGHFLGTPAQGHGMFAQISEHGVGLQPGWVGDQTVEGRTTTIRVDSRGLRGPEIGERKAGELRVLALGDSFVFGHGVAEEESLPANLQRLLSAQLAVPVTVANAGTPSNGTRELVTHYERQRDLRPDVILACTYIGNDLVDDCRQYAAVVQGFLLFGPMAREAQRSTRVRFALRYRTAYLIESLLRRHWPAAAFDLSKLVETPEEVEATRLLPPSVDGRFGGLFMDRRSDDALVAQVLARCRTNYRNLGEAAHPTPILHVLIPTWWHLDPTVWADKIRQCGFEPQDHVIGNTQRRLLQVGRELGLEMIDLTPQLSAAPDRDQLWLPIDRHLSVAGNARVAAWLVPHLRRLLGR